MKNLSAQNQAVILGIISVTAFAMTLPFSKIAVTHLSGIQVGLLRSLLAGIVAIPILYFTKSAFPNRSQTMRLFLASLGIIYGFPILSAMGMQNAPVGHGAVVLALLPLTTAVFGVLLTHKNMPAKFWLYSLAGVFTILTYIGYNYGLTTGGLTGGQGQYSKNLYLGDIYLGLAMVLASFGYAQNGQLASQMHGWQVICWMLALNLPIVLCASLFIVDFNRLNWLIMQGSFTEIGAILFLAWVSSLLGFFSWNKALAMGGIAKISQLQFLQTFITYAIAVLFMNEKLDVMAILAGMITVLIVFYTQKIARKG